ncbi:MAG: hypothetical protein QM726_21095 [Chitinophagaceae bacterium]
MYRDKGPMGTNIAYKLVPQEFDGEVVLASKALKGTINPFTYAKNTVYISIGKEMQADEDNLNALLNYVSEGNEFFIASTSIDSRLLDTLGIKRNVDFESYDSLLHKTNTFLRIADSSIYGGRKQYGFFYYPFKWTFTSYDTSTSRSLGVNDHGNCNYLVVRFGKGRFYIHAAPTAFTNYFLLTNDNVNYYGQVFSYLNKDASTVYWDDGYGLGKKQDDFSALSMFWKNPSLRYALLLACALLLLYIAFESKRKRRLVPVRVPNTNASLSFVRTISNLYRQRKDNRNIAVKMMTYFFEHVRSKYFLNTNNVNAEFVQALSRKSGVEESLVQTLMDKVAYINEAAEITDQELFEINNLIYEFYKS